MATLSTAIGRQPVFFQKRYSAEYVNWANQLLEELSGCGVMKDITYERGVLVDAEEWIDIPSEIRRVDAVFSPINREHEYQIEEVNGRIKLKFDTVEEDDDPETITAFSNQATTHIDVNIADADEDDFEDYLLWITAGNKSGNGYVIKSNDASAGGVTRLYFRHPEASAWAGADATAGALYGTDYYLMVKGTGTYTALTGTGDQIPIADKYETRLVDVYLRLAAERETKADSNETVHWEQVWAQTKANVIGEMLSGPVSPVRGRRLPGFVYLR